MESFADRLHRARKNAHMTQEQLGFELDVSKSSVSAWENGREKPSFRVLEQLPTLLGCSLDYLLCVASDQTHADESHEVYLPETCAKDTLERRMLECFRGLSNTKKRAILELLRQ